MNLSIIRYIVNFRHQILIQITNSLRFFLGFKTVGLVQLLISILDIVFMNEDNQLFNFLNSVIYALYYILMNYKYYFFLV